MAGELIDQLLRAGRQFSTESGQPHIDIPVWIMATTGGLWSIEPVATPEESSARAARGEDPAPFTDEQIREWLLYLVQRRRMLEDFLVIGIARYIEMRLEALIEDGAKGQLRFRNDASALDELMQDPKALDALLEEINSTLPDGTPKLTRDDIPRLRSVIHRMGEAPSLDELRLRKEALKRWQEIAGGLYLEAAHMPMGMSPWGS